MRQKEESLAIVTFEFLMSSFDFLILLDELVVLPEEAAADKSNSSKDLWVT